MTAAAPSRFAGWLAAILLLGGALRLIGITHGLDFDEPHLSIWNNQNDEETQALGVRDRHLLGNFDPGPGYWQWGSGGFHVYGFLDRVLLPVLGGIAGAPSDRAALATNLSLVLLAHRLAGVAAALAAIAIFAFAVRREIGERVAAFTAFFLATAYLCVRESHYGTLDPWLFLGTAVALDRASLLAGSPSWRNVLGAGFLAGFFAAFKYSGAALVGPPLLGIMIGVWRLGAPNRLPRIATRATALLAATALGYVALTPTIFRDFDALVAGFESQRGLIGFDFAMLPAMVGFHATKSLAVGFGIPLLVAAAFGIVREVADPKSRGRVAFIVLLLAACAALPLSNTSHSVRQALPCFPLLALCAALGVAPLATSRARSIVIALALAAPSLVRGVTFGWLVGRTDTRVDVMARLHDTETPPDDAIGIGFYGLPRTSGIAAPQPFLDWMDAVHRRRVVARESAKERRPRFIIRDLSSGVADIHGWVDFEAIVAAEYREVMALDGRRDQKTPALPDLEHGTPFHFVPFASPWQMTRPGPALVVYERLDSR
jgi:hypothetical protein